MADNEATPPGGYSREADVSRREVMSRVLAEHDVFQAQRERRIELLKKLEESNKGEKVAYISFLCGSAASLDSDDIPAFGDALLSIGEVDQLNLIINSPGGDGTVAEKIIELCHAYCKTFRVVVPNRAKSAATIIALGADEILMGYCSEIGPIDPQIPVVMAGIPHYISAQSFIDARKTLHEKFKEAITNKEDPRAILQEIAGLDALFIDYCEKLMDFSRDVAQKCLSKYMFAKIKNSTQRKRIIDKIIEGLSSTALFKVHGRMIDGNAAKTELALNVTLLGKDDQLWRDIWNYYVRTDVLLSRLNPLAKLVETKNEMLIKEVLML